MASRTLVTHALPYANGGIHLGHLVESVQTDVYVRALRASGREVVFICADDTHGTPIEVNAAKAGIPPEQFVARWYEEHRRDYAAFQIGFDEFYTTNSEENRRHAELIFAQLKEDGAVDKREIEQLYCEIDQRFLPDRYVKGTCPKCGTADQYGDACEKCGSTYEATELKDPYCALCKDAGRGLVTPVRRNSAHYFVRLAKYQSFLHEWTSAPGHLQPEIKRSIDGWLSEPLKDWDISRDAPYFGFKIPGEDAKYFYVWLDAPIGYLSSTEHWCNKQAPPRDVWEFWGAGADTEIIHFIGKDIVYFHTLFWPAMLHAAKRNIPAHVHVHGMLTVEGTKMSKSRGTFINASEYIDAGLDAEWLRYFFASNLGPTPSDIDLSLKEMMNRVNGELLNNVGNLLNRSLKLIATRFEGQIGRLPEDDEARAFLDFARETEEKVKAAYLQYDSRAAIQAVLALSSKGNERLQRRQPWKLIDTDRDAAHAELTLAANLARISARLLQPVLPKFACEAAWQLGLESRFACGERGALRDPWGDFRWLEGSRIGTPVPLVRKMEDADVQKLASRFVSESKPAEPAPAKAESRKSPTGEAPHPQAKVSPELATQVTPPAEISKEQFDAVDLRAGKILAVERIPKADRLLKLTVDLGEAVPRTICSGIARQYAPDELVGKTVAVVANLAARELRGVLSHGMILAVGGGARGLTVVELPDDVAPGAKVT